MPVATIPATMKAVRLEGPYNIVTKDVPVPQLEREDEVLVKVQLSGLCGSDLHYYRGHAKSPREMTMGHEIVGQIVRAGKGVQRLSVGDVVLSPFALNCGDCFYCGRMNTARCVDQVAFGHPAADGGQAEYIKLPFADVNLVKLPTDIPPEIMIVMTDILPTGFSVAQNARTILNNDLPRPAKEGVCVVIGCGPVGLCAITSATTMFDKVFATDIALHRLDSAAKHGAIALPLEELREAVKLATEGRGADAVLEVVGHDSALTTAVELVRPFGVVSSCGVHTRPFLLEGMAVYGKNIRFQFGRCSVPKFYEGALAVLKSNLDLFATFVENRIRLEDAAKYYELFEQNKIAKTIFVVD